jgi:hypothetical protein
MKQSVLVGCLAALGAAAGAALAPPAARGEEDLTAPTYLHPPLPPPVLTAEDVEYNAQKFVTTYLFEHVAEHLNKTAKPLVPFTYNGQPKCFTAYNDNGAVVYQRNFYETGKPQSEGAVGPQGYTGTWKH